MEGLRELEELFGFIGAAGIRSQVEIDLSLARGLNYYTGAIFEVKALDYQIGSICGGGRYDNLTGIFGLPDMSGVGVSLGFPMGNVTTFRFVRTGIYGTSCYQGRRTTRT
jgi:histidyl-tRNA synthetase